MCYTLGVSGSDNLEVLMEEHVHSAACRAGNELDELCCSEASGAYLQACGGWDVMVPGRLSPLQVFASDAADALALARAAGYQATLAVCAPREFGGEVV
jgi:hypothetical protein